FLCADEPPMHAMPIAAPYAVHAHAKDFLVREENPGEGWFQSRGGKFLRGTVVGHGDVNVRECVRQLRSDGYDGWLSLEFEGMERNLDALRWGLAYLQHLLRED
ncbi:MAG: TIM barrel protein, partial [Christensenellales bacterium]|nr:TIM barrel protein [Christensenellales bacterium]